MDRSFTSYHIEDRSFASYIKREIHREATHGHFTRQQIGEIDIIVSELTSNLVKHAGSGELLYRIFNHQETESTFEILCMDKGPGIADLNRMKKDGNSTTNTLGQGLGAIERLSNYSQVYSMPGWGTILLARITTRKAESIIRKNGREIGISALCVNKPNETVCGDGYRIRKMSTGVQVFFGDGLGHGPQAKEAVDRAGDFFLDCDETEPVAILRKIHETVRRTRGLVATIVTIDNQRNEWTICGVGNIITRMYSGMQYRNYPGYNGTVGLNIPNTMKSTTYPIEARQHLVMCSDGLLTRWDLNRYPSVFKYDNVILAAALYRDYSRRTDDASVLIAKVS